MIAPNPFPWIAAADVVVLPSSCENVGNLIEAMALGVAVLATDRASGPEQIIEHGFNGFLVPVSGEDELAKCCQAPLTGAALRDRIEGVVLKRSEVSASERWQPGSCRGCRVAPLRGGASGVIDSMILV